MLLVSYDITDNKLRARFAKLLNKYGNRLQYSLFEIQNSERILKNVCVKIESDFAHEFNETDSIMIFNLSQTCKITKYGYARHLNEDLIIL